MLLERMRLREETTATSAENMFPTSDNKVTAAIIVVTEDRTDAAGATSLPPPPPPLQPIDDSTFNRLTLPVESIGRSPAMTAKVISVTISRDGGGATGIATDVRRQAPATIEEEGAAGDERVRFLELALEVSAEEEEVVVEVKESFSDWMRKHRENEVLARRRQLDSEKVVLYQRRKAGAAGQDDIVQNVCSHKRKRFELPSLDQRYQRYKMLKEQETERVKQKERQEEFMQRHRNYG